MSSREINNIYKLRDYDHLFKLIMIGDTGVGKSSLLVRLADDLFTENYLSTIGVDFRFKSAELPDPDNKNKKLKLKLQIWDTAGQEKFRAITRAYYRGADGLLIVYDITEKQSFDNVKNWIKEVRNNIDHTIPIIIVGNKSDRDDRVIQESELEKLALEFNTFHMETSALNSDNVEKTFLLLANECLNIKLNDNSGHVDSHTVPFIDNPKPVKNKCTC